MSFHAYEGVWQSVANVPVVGSWHACFGRIPRHWWANFPPGFGVVTAFSLLARSRFFATRTGLLSTVMLDQRSSCRGSFNCRCRLCVWDCDYRVREALMSKRTCVPLGRWLIVERCGPRSMRWLNSRFGQIVCHRALAVDRVNHQDQDLIMCTYSRRKM